MLFFAALMLTLGVKAQEGSTVEERGAAKGYYPFAAEVTGMTPITSLDQLTDGLEIMIQHSHEGTDFESHTESYLTIYSLPTYGVAHIVFMQEKPVGVGVWKTQLDANAGTLKLKSAHMVITGGTCYLGQLNSDMYGDADLKTSANYVGDYQFVPTSDGKWTIYCTNTNKYLGVDASSGSPVIRATSEKDAGSYFKVYKVTSKSTEQVKYVECNATLTGPSGNTFTTWQAGWNDFYEFLMEEANYGVSLTNVVYHELSNEITGRVKFPFTVSGDRVEIPVHLNPSDDLTKRFAVDGNNNIVIVEEGGEGWYNNPNNQWYIRPFLNEARQFSYAIQNVGTKKYIHTAANSYDVSLSDEPTYFTHKSGAPEGQVRFTSIYTSPTTGNSYTTYLIYDGNKVHTKTQSNFSDSDVVNLTVTRISGEELGGEDAVGFVRRYTYGTSFWDGGQVARENAPVELQEVFNDDDHEGKNTVGSNHLLYCAETGIKVTKLDDVTATFAWAGGSDQLVILGVDIVDNIGQAVYADYHLGTAGQNPQDNVYTLKDVFPGEYTIRYWVCNRTDNEEDKNHNLNNTSGSITVTGANYRIMFSQPLVNEQFAANTTWFRLRLSDALEKYISAQPDYMDADNNLKLTNDTPPTDYAGMWAIVGNATDGYKFYNHAWGPEYALKTTGANAAAHTFMAPVDEATTYDIVSGSDYKFYVKVHGSANNYLNKRGDYLALWDSADGLGDQGSVMTFETVNMEAFEANTEKMIKDNLLIYYIPWTACDEITVPANTDFVSLMKGRKAAAQALNGKLFKFANKGSGDRNGRFLGINADGQSVGLKGTTTMDGFVQLVHNGDLTFKLYHPATGKYFGTPGKVVDAASNAANYTFQVYGDETQTVVFVTGNQMIHMYNYSPYSITNYNDIADGASRWTVSCDDTMQDLVDLLAEAKAKYATVSAADYQANIGVPGYATTATIDALKAAIDNALVATDYATAVTDLQNKKQAVITEEVTPLFPTDCYFTITDDKPNRGSIIYNSSKTDKNKENGVDDFLWHTNSVDKTNADHLWCFYQEPVTGEYYLYNVGKKQFANPYGKGSFTGEPGYTWVFSNTPAAITMSALDEYPYFHIQGGADKLTMSVSTFYTGSVITYYEKKNGTYDAGMYFKFAKSENPVSDEVTAAMKALSEAYAESKFNEAKAAATALLTATPEAVGYPNATERTKLETAITTATDVPTLDAVQLAFKETTNVNMPESGKAYVFTNVHHNGTKNYLNYTASGLTLVARGDVAANELPESAKWYCRKLDDGRYTFVNSAGKYLVWRGKDVGTNSVKGYTDNYDADWSPLTFVKMTTNGSNTGRATKADLFGYVAFGGKRETGKNSYFITTWSANGTNFNQDGSWTLRYESNYHSTAFLVEEVTNYPFANTKLTATSKEKDKLLKGIENGQTVSTFSAPYATVIPAGVTAYYAKKASQGETLYLTAVESGKALPACQGVILIGEEEVTTGNFVPATTEILADLSANVLKNTAKGDVEAEDNDYALAKGGEGIGIYKVKEGTKIKAGKAYLRFDTPSQARSFVLSFSGAPTAIEDSLTDTADAERPVIYDLYGRRVNETIKGGIYIVNGKKVFIK